MVNIYTSRLVNARRVSPLFNDPFFQRFFGPGVGPGQPQQREQNSLGSGVIVAADGIVVTNHHVIENADQVTVVLPDRTEYDAEIMVSDEATDLAVLRLRGVEDTLPTVSLAPSDDLAVGDLVLAIGNPFGVGQTVTMGIVSALARTTAGITDYSFFIQTDAAINPGNSGGALVDIDGNLIGINTAIYSSSGGSLGIGFAIPSEMIQALLDGIERGSRRGCGPGSVPRASRSMAAIAESLDLDRPAGVLISRVISGSPADRAGIGRRRRRLVDQRPDGRRCRRLRYRVATLRVGNPGAAGDFARRRRGHACPCRLKFRRKIPPRNVTALRGPHPLSGAVVANLSPALIAEIGYEGEVRDGVIVLDINRGSVAGRVGILRPGDIILDVNGANIVSVGVLSQAVAHPQRLVAVGRTAR